MEQEEEHKNPKCQDPEVHHQSEGKTSKSKHCSPVSEVPEVVDFRENLCWTQTDVLLVMEGGSGL